MPWRADVASLVRWAGEIPGVGRVLRRLASAYREGSVVTIRCGEAAGFRWERSHRHVNGYWIGHYEIDVQRTIARFLSPGDVFWDVGANAGFFSLVAARAVGPTGEVVAVEPVPENAAGMARQFALNGLSWCHVVQAAVASTAGTAVLDLGPSSSQAHLAATGEAGGDRIEVEVVTLDDLVRAHRRPRLVKIDVEGTEDRVLAGGESLLRSDGPPGLLIEIHRSETARAVESALESRGYAVRGLGGAPSSGAPGHVLATVPVGRRLPST